MAGSEIIGRIEQAHKRISKKVRNTPLEYSAWLSQCSSSAVYIKSEHDQLTNSFKIRGATNKILTLKEQQKEQMKFVTASSGNHGLACAKAVEGTGMSCIICVGEKTSPAKIKGLKRLNATIERHGIDCLETEMYAKNLAEKTGAIYVSPYNDIDVIAGQGTIGMEVLAELPGVDAMFISVGGGGLISGIASYLKHKNPKIEIVGCQPENSAVMYESIKAGRILEMESLPTLSNGTAGGIEQGSVTFDICKSLVDKWVLVSENEISNAVYGMVSEHCKIVEGASGVAIAAFLKTKQEYKDKNIVILSCGGNISVETLKMILDENHEAKN